MKGFHSRQIQFAACSVFIRLHFISCSEKMGNTAELILFVQKYPILYDHSHPEYKNTRAKDKIWTEIGKEFNESGKQLKKKWKNLRDTYAKYIRSCKMKTGQTPKKIKPWIWAQHMEGFRSYLTHAKTKSNINEITSKSLIVSENDNFEVENTHLHAEHSTPSVMELTNATPTASEVTPKKKKEKRFISPSLSVEDIINYFENKGKIERDAIDALMIAHAKTIKTFSARRQIITKIKIAQVIMEQELLQEEELKSSKQHNSTL